MRQLVILLLLGCTSCAMGGPGVEKSAPASAAKTEEGTLPAIRQLIGTPSCSDSSQCHSLPIGARGCGGPEYYLAWSSARTPSDQLQALGERYKAERAAQNAASGAVSDCRYAVDPGAVCNAGTCQLRTDPLVR